MDKEQRTYAISEAARELGISAEWLRKGEERGFSPKAPRAGNGHRYYTSNHLDRLLRRRQKEAADARR